MDVIIGAILLGKLVIHVCYLLSSRKEDYWISLVVYCSLLFCIGFNLTLVVVLVAIKVSSI